MSYLVPIKAALIIFPFLALLITLPYIIYEYHHYGSVNKLRTLIIYSFILYLMTIYFLVILPLPTKEEVIKMKVNSINIHKRYNRGPNRIKTNKHSKNNNYT